MRSSGPKCESLNHRAVTFWTGWSMTTVGSQAAVSAHWPNCRGVPLPPEAVLRVAVTDFLSVVGPRSHGWCGLDHVRARPVRRPSSRGTAPNGVCATPTPGRKRWFAISCLHEPEISCGRGISPSVVGIALNLLRERTVGIARRTFPPLLPSTTCILEGRRGDLWPGKSCGME